MMKKILLVEDNEMNRDMLSRRLRRKGVEVEIAETGEQALQMMDSSIPDLILMDLSLPGISGLEATQKLKANENTRGIPIIALTANAMTSDREQALATGCDEFEAKPVDFERLYAKIEQFVGEGNGE